MSYQTYKLRDLISAKKIFKNVEILNLLKCKIGQLKFVKMCKKFEEEKNKNYIEFIERKKG